MTILPCLTASQNRSGHSDMERQFVKNPVRELPDGSITRVYPFHVSLEGLERKVLCREEADYDMFVKFLCLCARRKNVVLVIYAVVSNHAHCIILAADQAGADSFVDDVKKVYSMYFSRKYQDLRVLKRNDAQAIYLDTDYYVRNAIAYVVRNAMDNGALSVQEYKWTGLRAAFCGGKVPAGKKVRQVKALSKREKRDIMRTGDRLYDVRWLINEANELEPVSFCDWRYVEGAFRHDQSFFLRLIGGVNTAEMNSKLIDSPRTRRTDNELMLSVDEISQRWFSTTVHDLPEEKKARLLPYVYHCFRTTTSQLARVFELSPEKICRLIGKKKQPS